MALVGIFYDNCCVFHVPCALKTLRYREILKKSKINEEKFAVSKNVRIFAIQYRGIEQLAQLVGLITRTAGGSSPPPATKGAVTRCKSTSCGTSRKEPCAGFVPRLNTDHGSPVKYVFRYNPLLFQCESWLFSFSVLREQSMRSVLIVCGAR